MPSLLTYSITVNVPDAPNYLICTWRFIAKQKNYRYRTLRTALADTSLQASLPVRHQGNLVLM